MASGRQPSSAPAVHFTEGWEGEPTQPDPSSTLPKSGSPFPSSLLQPPSPVDRHLVRGFLLPGQPVAAFTTQRVPPGKQQRQGRHHLRFLLHPRLGEDGPPMEGRAGGLERSALAQLHWEWGRALPGPLLVFSVTGKIGKKAPLTPCRCSPALGIVLGALVQ